MKISSLVIGILAGVINIVAFAIYNYKIIDGSVIPNITAWIIWAFITALNFTSYFAMSRDWVISILPIVSSIQCIMTAGVSIFVGQLKSLNKYDFAVLALGVIAGAIWKILRIKKSKNAALAAQTVLQACIFIGFIPQFQSVYAVPGSENAFCWLLWSFGFALNGAAVVMRWEAEKKYAELMYPVNCFWEHGLVGLLAFR